MCEKLLDPDPENLLSLLRERDRLLTENRRLDHRLILAQARLRRVFKLIREILEEEI